MDDKFLYTLREEPDAAFTKELQKNLMGIQPESKKKMMRIPQLFSFNKHAKFTRVLVSLAIVLGIAMTVTPVRAIIQEVTEEIAGRLFKITDDYPGGGKVTTIYPEIMTLYEALAVFPYPVILPTNVPSDYQLDEGEVRVYLNKTFPDSLYLSWVGERKGVHLMVCGNCNGDGGQRVAPDSVEEVLLKDQHPAALIRGGWYQNEKAWDYDLGFTLEWDLDGVLYHLSSGTMTAEQLIEIAESTLE